MVNSQVPKVELKLDGSTVLTVRVVGFAESKSVDISGYVTQNSGAYAAFKVTEDLPKPDEAGVAEVEVTLSSAELELAEAEPVTIVTWVSEVWPSMLIEDTPTSPDKAAWKIDQAATDRWRSKSGASSGMWSGSQ